MRQAADISLYEGYHEPAGESRIRGGKAQNPGKTAAKTGAEIFSGGGIFPGKMNFAENKIALEKSAPRRYN